MPTQFFGYKTLKCLKIKRYVCNVYWKYTLEMPKKLLLWFTCRSNTLVFRVYVSNQVKLCKILCNRCNFFDFFRPLCNFMYFNTISCTQKKMLFIEQNLINAWNSLKITKIFDLVKQILLAVEFCWVKEMVLFDQRNFFSINQNFIVSITTKYYGWTEIFFFDLTKNFSERGYHVILYNCTWSLYVIPM